MTQRWEPGGWRFDKEDHDALYAVCENQSAILAMRGTYTEVKFDPRDVLRVEKQGRQGACQGHSLTSIMEWIHCLKTGKPGLQLSREMAYYETQRIDGIRGDRGSTISGGVRLAMRVGVCEERLWPYSGDYDNRRPRNWDAIIDNAETYKVGNQYRLTSYDAIRTFIGSGQGGVHLGISWGNGMNARVLERHYTGRGGHAIALLALSERLDRQGRPYIWMFNSWGRRWGNEGWAEWSPTAVEQMCRHDFTVAIGLTDMPRVTPRKFSREEWKQRLQAA